MTDRARNRHPTDVSDEEWAPAAPYLTLMDPDAPQREYPPREAFAADEQERAQVAAWAEAVQEATGETVGPAFVEQGYAGGDPAEAAKSHGIELCVVKHPRAKKGFVPLPRRRVVERSFAWLARFRLARDHERLTETVAGRHWLAFAALTLHLFTRFAVHRS